MKIPKCVHVPKTRRSLRKMPESLKHVDKCRKVTKTCRQMPESYKNLSINAKNSKNLSQDAGKVQKTCQ